MTQAFLIDAATGATLQRVTVPSPAYLVASDYGAGREFIVFDGEGDIEDFETAAVDGAVAVVPRVIDPAVVLAVAKIDARAAVKARRDAVRAGGCATPSGRVDTDAVSLQNINGAVSMAALLGADFATEWRMSDNGIVTLDAAAMVGVGMAVGQFATACQARKNVLDAAIDAAASLADLAAIDLASGWPG